MAHEMRWGGIAGIAAIVCAIIGRLVLGSVPGITDSANTIATWVGGHRGQIMVAALLYGIAIVLALWFGAALATAFRRADDPSDAPAVVLAGFALVAAIGFFAVSLFAGLTYAMTTHGELMAFAAGPYTAVAIVGTIAGLAAVLPLAASAVAIGHTHVFPMWMAWFAALAAVLRGLSAFTIGITGGVLAPGSFLVAVVPAVVAGLWVLAACYFMVREQVPVAAPVIRHA